MYLRCRTIQGSRSNLVILQTHHKIFLSLQKTFYSSISEPTCQHTVKATGITAALNMPQDGNPYIEIVKLFSNSLCQCYRTTFCGLLRNYYYEGCLSPFPSLFQLSDQGFFITPDLGHKNSLSAGGDAGME